MSSKIENKLKIALGLILSFNALNSYVYASDVKNNNFIEILPLYEPVKTNETVLNINYLEDFDKSDSNTSTLCDDAENLPLCELVKTNETVLPINDVEKFNINDDDTSTLCVDIEMSDDEATKSDNAGKLDDLSGYKKVEVCENNVSNIYGSGFRFEDLPPITYGDVKPFESQEKKQNLKNQLKKLKIDATKPRLVEKPTLVLVPDNIWNLKISKDEIDKTKNCLGRECVNKLTKNIGCSNVESLEIPPGLFEIKSGAFKEFKWLVKADLSDVKKIMCRAFSDCYGLRVIKMDNVTFVGKCAFENCGNLEAIYLPKVIRIGEEAFENCGKLKCIDIRNARNIGFNAFVDCDSLKKNCY